VVVGDFSQTADRVCLSVCLSVCSLTEVTNDHHRPSLLAAHTGRERVKYMVRIRFRDRNRVRITVIGLWSGLALGPLSTDRDSDRGVSLWPRYNSCNHVYNTCVCVVYTMN